MRPVLVHLLALRSLRLQSYVLSATFPNLPHLTGLSLHSVRFASPTGFSKFMSDFPQLQCLALEEISFAVEVKDGYASDLLALPESEALSVCPPEMLRLLFDVSPCDVLIRTLWHNMDQDRFQHIPVYLRRLCARLQCLQLSCYVSSQIMELTELDFASSTGLCRLQIDHALLFNEMDGGVELLSMNPGTDAYRSRIGGQGRPIVDLIRLLDREGFATLGTLKFYVNGSELSYDASAGSARNRFEAAIKDVFTRHPTRRILCTAGDDPDD
ncbi:hypothetical protein C8J57DRAFT_1514425 [Mycena rebaudengoi]|nr:hypothetical protein C8J57DRAFT_1514425 [Mycena rebaudengoi]